MFQSPGLSLTQGHPQNLQLKVISEAYLQTKRTHSYQQYCDLESFVNNNAYR